MAERFALLTYDDLASSFGILCAADSALHGTCTLRACRSAVPSVQHRTVVVSVDSEFRPCDDRVGRGFPQDWLALSMKAAISLCPLSPGLDAAVELHSLLKASSMFMKR